MASRTKVVGWEGCWWPWRSLSGTWGPRVGGRGPDVIPGQGDPTPLSPFLSPRKTLGEDH
jgi:hypothetical protein